MTRRAASAVVFRTSTRFTECSFLLSRQRILSALLAVSNPFRLDGGRRWNLHAGSVRSQATLQIPGFSEVSGQVLLGILISGDTLPFVVPVNPVSGAIGNVSQKTDLRQAVSITYVASRLQVARLDSIEKLTEMSGRIRDRRFRPWKVVNLLPAHMNLVPLVVGHDRGFS